jgi:hypothetical protein
VPGPGWNGDKVERLHVPDLVGKQALTPPAQDHHGVDVLVPFQRGIAARCHLEVTELTAKRGMGEQLLAGDGLVGRRVVLLVRA